MMMTRETKMYSKAKRNRVVVVVVVVVPARRCPSQSLATTVAVVR
jgi:hypothetical protein